MTSGAGRLSGVVTARSDVDPIVPPPPNEIAHQVGLAGPDPDENKNNPRRLWVMKSNVGQYPPPLGVTFTPHPQYPDVAPIGYGAPPVPYRAPNKSDDCADWLEELLRNAAGPMRPKEVYEPGKSEGYNSRMILRVRKALGGRIQDTQERVHPENEWKWVGEEEMTNEKMTNDK
jgi:hypothetical protein